MRRLETHLLGWLGRRGRRVDVQVFLRERGRGRRVVVDSLERRLVVLYDLEADGWREITCRESMGL